MLSFWVYFIQHSKALTKDEHHFLLKVAKPELSLCLYLTPSFLISWTGKFHCIQTSALSRERAICKKHKNQFVTFHSVNGQLKFSLVKKHVRLRILTGKTAPWTSQKMSGSNLRGKSYCSFDSTFQLLRDCCFLPSNTPCFGHSGHSR